MRAKENSSPSVKTRKTTPTSASVRIDSSSSSTAQRVRPEQHADEQVTQDRWQRKTPYEREYQQ
jgi:hypothetical protein